EHKNLARLRVSDIDIVLGVHGHALRCHHRILVALRTFNEPVFLPVEIEDVDTPGSRVCDDHPPSRVDGNAVGPNKIGMLGLPSNRVQELRPKTWLASYI